MVRLIDADALIEKFDKDKYDRVRNEYQSGYNDGMLHAEVVADNFPTVDAVPVKHGKWIMFDSEADKFDDIKCSECGKEFTVDAFRWCDIGFTINDLHYCPNCGARMDEE